MLLLSKRSHQGVSHGPNCPDRTPVGPSYGPYPLPLPPFQQHGYYRSDNTGPKNHNKPRTKSHSSPKLSRLVVQQLFTWPKHQRDLNFRARALPYQYCARKNTSCCAEALHREGPPRYPIYLGPPFLVSPSSNALFAFRSGVRSVHIVHKIRSARWRCFLL